MVEGMKGRKGKNVRWKERTRPPWIMACEKMGLWMPLGELTWMRLLEAMMAGLRVSGNPTLLYLFKIGIAVWGCEKIWQVTELALASNTGSSKSTYLIYLNYSRERR